MRDLLFPLALLVAGLVSAADASTRTAADLEKGFAAPPPDARPQVWWHWMNGNVSKAGITADLEAMAAAGIGGATVFDLGYGIPKGPVAFNTDAWFDCLLHAHREAKRLGLQLVIANSSGFSSSGGPWVKPEDSMKFVEWSETVVRGPRRFSGRLAQPRSEHGYYRDIAVFAVRNPPAERPGRRNGGTVACADSADRRVRTVTETFARPWVASELQYRVSGIKSMWSAELALKVEASDDGETFRTLLEDPCRKFTFGGQICELPTEVALPVTTARVYRATFAFKKDKAAASHRVEDVDFGSFARFGDLGRRTLRYADGAPPRSRERPGTAIPERDVIDLTGRMGGDGSLDWTVPDGEWTILRFGAAATGSRSVPTTDAGAGLEVDKFSVAALGRHMDAYVGRVARLCGIDPKTDPIRRAGLYAVLIDSYEVGTQNWGDDFAAEFKARMGYEAVSPLFLSLTGRVIGSAERTDRFLEDYREVIGQLFTERYADAFTRKCHEYGLCSTVEAYDECPCNHGRYGWNTDVPMTEFWAPPADRSQRLYPGEGRASVAHFFGRRYVGSESFTSAPPVGSWRQDPFAYKATGDAVYASGVNRIVYHRWAHQPWVSHVRPGMTMGPTGTQFERTQTWWPMVGPWLRYQARTQFLLQEGRHAADILRFSGDEIPNWCSWDCPSGWKSDVLPREAFPLLTVESDGSVVSPGGARYRMIAVPGGGIRLESARALVALARKGANIGWGGDRRLGLAGEGAADEELRAIVREMRRLPNVVFAGDMKAIERFVPAPDFRSADDTLSWAHRIYEDGTEAYFIASERKDAHDSTVSLRSVGADVELWDAETGERVAAEWRPVDGRSEVRIPFRPCGSVFAMIRKERSRCPRKPSETIVSERTLDGDWKLTFPTGWYWGEGTRKTVALDALTSWTDLEDPDFKYFSGVAEYEKTVTDVTGAGRVILDLGVVKNLAEVTVNGRTYEALWRPPYRLDVTDAVRDGKLDLRIRVANLWPNRLIGDAALPQDVPWANGNAGPVTEIPDWVRTGAGRSPNGRHTFVTWKLWHADSALLPSGLLGPVRILVEDSRRTSVCTVRKECGRCGRILMTSDD